MEEYDSDPSDTGSDTDDNFSGSEGEQERKRAEKAERKKTSKPSEKRSRQAQSGGGKKKKKTKLPGQPKKPMSSYFLWLQEEGRSKIKEENPGLSVTEVGKKSGDMWREMAKSEAKTKAAKEKYNIEYKEWLEGGGAEALKQEAKKLKTETKKAKTVKSPKKASTTT